MKYYTDGEAETLLCGKKYAENLKAGDVVLLYGEMGAGKTAFTKGIAEGLGITANVTSPTYAYMNDYDGKLYHYDCYRLTSGDDAESLGLTDYFYAGGICVVEWAQNIKSVLPDNCITVNIKKLGENKRSVEF